MADTLYHVTTLKNALKIIKKGIEPNKKQLWRRPFGNFKKGFIYAFTDYLDSVRWAFKLDWDLNQLEPVNREHVVIISFAADVEQWERDTHIESAGYRGKWVKTRGTVAPENIHIMVMENRWRLDVHYITASDYMTLEYAGAIK